MAVALQSTEFMKAFRDLRAWCCCPCQLSAVTSRLGNTDCLAYLVYLRSEQKTEAISLRVDEEEICPAVVQRSAKRWGCLLSYSQADPGRELTQPRPRLLAQPCIWNWECLLGCRHRRFLLFPRLDTCEWTSLSLSLSPSFSLQICA